MPGNAVMINRYRLIGDRGRYGLVGDPFIGAVLGALPLARRIPGVSKVIGAGTKLLQRVIPATRTAIAAAPGGGRVLRIGGIAGRTIAAGAGLELGAMGLRRALERAELPGRAPRYGGPLEAFQPQFGVRRRRINPLNPRALTRAMRRVAAFDSRARTAQCQLARIAGGSQRRRRKKAPCR